MSLFDIISVVLCEAEEEWRTDPNIFLRMPASAADAVAVSPKGINTLFTNGVITFFISGNLFLVMDQAIYLKILLIVYFW